MDDGEPVDSVGPWTIKAVSTRTRVAVNVAAKRENLTVGQWLERRVDEWEGRGSPVAVAGPAPVVDLAGLAQAMDAARALADSAGVTIPAQMAREAIITVRRAMRAARGLPPPPGRRKPSAAIEG